MRKSAVSRCQTYDLRDLYARARRYYRTSAPEILEKMNSLPPPSSQEPTAYLECVMAALFLLRLRPDASAQYQARHRALGLCVHCPQKAWRPGSSYCPKHRDKRRTLADARRTLADARRKPRP